MTLDNPKCETCRWWKKHNSGEGRCHIRSPKSGGYFPHVFEDDFCGEHSELAKKSAITDTQFDRWVSKVKQDAAIDGLLSGGTQPCTTDPYAESCRQEAEQLRCQHGTADVCKADEHDWETLRIEHGGYDRKCRLCGKFEFVQS